MSIVYEINKKPTGDEFISLLQSSGLAERRPVDNRQCLIGMMENANLVITARVDGLLIGIARSMTDFHYACYLSDLAVDRAYQGQGVGTMLQTITLGELKPSCKLILLAAPAANGYYARLGFENNPRCWIFSNDRDFPQSLEEKL